MIAPRPSILRKAYDSVALFAVLNLLAFVGLATYFWGTGRWDRTTLTRAVSVLLGQGPHSVPKSPTLEPVRAPVLQAVRKSDDAPVPNAEEIEMLRHESERIKVELEQQLSLVKAMMLKVNNERDALKKEQLAAAQKGDDSLRNRRQDGFKKQVEIYEGLTPKVALDHLLRLDDPDQAARILTELEPRQVKKIVEAARSGEQSRQMQAILQRVQDVAGESSEELANKEP